MFDKAIELSKLFPDATIKIFKSFKENGEHC